MPRHSHAVRRGLQDQRDRGRRKKHHKSIRTPSDELRQRTTPENWEEKLRFFDEWLEEHAKEIPQMAADRVSSMSLTKFLQSSPNVDIAPDEKLRRLAIHLEPDCECMVQPKGWHVLRRIYREALKYDRNWPWHYHSMSVSITSCAECLDPDDPVRELLYRESVSICHDGIAVDSNVSSLFSKLGRSLYELRELEKALDAYEQAIAIDAGNMWAVLYRAHCLHDLERWAAAVTAYEAVDPSFFDGIKSWRAVLVRDQLAICRMHAGDLVGALVDFEQSLHRYETNPGLLVTKQYLEEAACGALLEQLRARVDALQYK